MAYILAINPAILGDAGMDRNAVLTATCEVYNARIQPYREAIKKSLIL